MSTSNSELLKRYGEWLVCQRYSRTGREVYKRIASKFAAFWGRRRFSEARHLDIREFFYFDNNFFGRVYIDQEKAKRFAAR
jgi:hypothetical protein